MSIKKAVLTSLHCLHTLSIALAVIQFGIGGQLAIPVQAAVAVNIAPTGDPDSVTPIKHLIVLIGENRTFDHLFATYVSPSGDHVQNLLSEGIIDAKGQPGGNFGKAAQFQAIAPFQPNYFISLGDSPKESYKTLPMPTLNFSPSPATGEPPPFPTGTPAGLLAVIEPSLENWRSRSADHRGVWGRTNC